MQSDSAAQLVSEGGVPRRAASKPGFFTKRGLWTPSESIKEATSTYSSNPPKLTFQNRFDRRFPPYRRYLGRSRRTFLFILLGVILCLLALILGVGLGLGLRNSPSNLPLPSNTAIFTGDLTYYSPALGACGITSSSTDMVCAVSHIIFDAASTSGDPNQNPLCGKKIRVTRFNEQVNANRSIDVTVVDRCVGCNADDLDLSPSAFDDLAAQALGRVTGRWAWLS